MCIRDSCLGMVDLPVGKCGSEIARFLFRRHGDATADSCQFMGNSYSQCTGENYNKLG